VKNSSEVPKNLPKIFFFTDRKRVEDIFKVVRNLPKNTAIIIREYDFDYLERLDFARKISLIAKQNNQKIFVGKSLEIAREIDADGVHFSDKDRKVPRTSNLQNMLLSYSCHSLKSLAKARKLNPDLVFFSPIFVTNSHLNQKPVGVFALRNFVKKSAIPTYALGGINRSTIKLLSGSNIAGIGAIDYLLKT
jgi:thiamine-phosphate diphosphorylase